MYNYYFSLKLIYNTIFINYSDLLILSCRSFSICFIAIFLNTFCIALKIKEKIVKYSLTTYHYLEELLTHPLSALIDIFLVINLLQLN
jgi:hypothetical protein